MLVLTRKPNQQLHIGNDIVITIVKVRGNTIRLGIEAPKDVRVLRSELDPKPASGTAAHEDSQASAAAAPSDAQPDTDSDASADDAQEAARVQPATTAPLIFEARIKQPALVKQVAPAKQSAPIKQSASSGAPLKRFAASATAKRSRGVFSDRNVEDCPLCHRAPQAPAMPQPALTLSLSAAGR